MNLTEVFDRATDAVEPPGLAGTVLRQARERRARRRMAAGAAAAVVAVVGTSVVVAQQGGNRPAPVGPSSPSETTDDAAPGARDPVGPRWDPATVVDAPLRESVLPDRLEPPVLPPSVADRPIEAAVVAWPEAGHDLRLLSTDGEWRCVEGTADAVADLAGGVVRPALSDDGTQVAMATDAGILVVDLTTGDQRTIAWDEPLAGPWDSVPAVQWLPDGEFLVPSWPRTWIVAEDGEARPAPYGRRFRAVAVDPAGAVVEKRYDYNDLRVWRGDDLVATTVLGHWGERLVARYGRLALTGGGNSLPGDGGPMVVDVATGDVVAYRPIRDPFATYSDNGHLTAVGFLDEDTVLYLVGPARRVDRRTVVDAWHLIAWDLGTGEFERVATGPDGLRTIDVAASVLAGG